MVNVFRKFEVVADPWCGECGAVANGTPTYHNGVTRCCADCAFGNGLLTPEEYDKVWLMPDPQMKLFVFQDEGEYWIEQQMVFARTLIEAWEYLFERFYREHRNKRTAKRLVKDVKDRWQRHEFDVLAGAVKFNYGDV